MVWSGSEPASERRCGGGGGGGGGGGCVGCVGAAEAAGEAAAVGAPPPCTVSKCGRWDWRSSRRARFLFAGVSSLSAGAAGRFLPAFPLNGLPPLVPPLGPPLVAPLAAFLAPAAEASMVLGWRSPTAIWRHPTVLPFRFSRSSKPHPSTKIRTQIDLVIDRVLFIRLLI